VYFLGELDHQISCEQGFSNFLGMRKSSTTIKPGKYSSLCFSQSGYVNYNVRMDAMVPGGELIQTGLIRIEPSRTP
jgi:hypothetical protein